ncbi:hypothetical protein KM043_002271 [Ampulex compressa]|nr:hypothetical protein KM043_002271 [Ampulex compressa]
MATGDSGRRKTPTGTSSLFWPWRHNIAQYLAALGASYLFRIDPFEVSLAEIGISKYERGYKSDVSILYYSKALWSFGVVNFLYEILWKEHLVEDIAARLSRDKSLSSGEPCEKLVEWEQSCDMNGL